MASALRLLIIYSNNESACKTISNEPDSKANTVLLAYRLTAYVFPYANRLALPFASHVRVGPRLEMTALSSLSMFKFQFKPHSM